MLIVMAVIANARASVIRSTSSFSSREARSSLHGLDHGMRHLFPRSRSNGVRSVQVFVCSVKRAVHIKVSCLCSRTSCPILLVMFHIFDMSSARQNRGQHFSRNKADPLAVLLTRRSKCRAQSAQAEPIEGARAASVGCRNDPPSRCGASRTVS